MRKRALIAAGAAAAVVIGVGTVAAVEGFDGPADPPKSSRVSLAAWPAADAGVAGGTKRAERGGDFNGDGRRDLLVDMGDGSLMVFYSGPQGPTAEDPEQRQRLTLDSPGIPGKAVQGSASRAIVGLSGSGASADFDHDGFDDLVALSNHPAARLMVIYGGPQGLTDRVVTLRVPRAKPGDAVSGEPVIGDFGGNGKLDLVIGVRERLRLYRNLIDRPVEPEEIPNPGTFVEQPMIGDFNGDGYSDLVTVAFLKDTQKTRGELRLGTVRGVSSTASVFAEEWINERDGIVADVNGDGRDDLIIRDIDAAPQDGKAPMSVVPGTPEGLGARQKFDVPCHGSSVESSIATGDLNGDGRSDVAVGCDKVVVLPGTAEGVDPAQVMLLDWRGIDSPTPASPERPWFADAMTIGDLTGDGKAELSFRIPVQDGARLYTLPGTATGPTLKGATVISAGQLGIGPNELGARFGDRILR